jgi:hypothetical protein
MTEGNGVRPAGVLTPLRRNRFFYGKLMDTRHWELEQEYGIQSRRLVNRLGLGAGILCGLGVRIGDGGTVCIDPGVAVDACGREIVVGETVSLSRVDQPTDDCAHPIGDPVRNGPVTIWLCYHECGSEYTRLTGGDCGHREKCVPGLLDERFALRIGAGPPDRQPGLTADACQSIFPGDPQGPPRRQVVASLLAGPCTDRADSCVPIATVSLDDAGAATAVGVDYRTPLYSNQELFDLLMCLAARVEECCQHQATQLAPRVMEVWPPLAGGIAEEDLRAFSEEARLEIVFERAMKESDFDQTDGWLGVWQVGGGKVARLPLRRSDAPAAHVRPRPGEEVVVFEVTVDRERNDRDLAFVVMIHATPGGGIVAGDDGAALDADFAGTGLTEADRAELWKLPADGRVLPSGVGDHVISGAPVPVLPSGDRSAGGDLHGAAARAQVAVLPAPELEHVWPAGAATLSQSNAPEEIRRFFEHPRLEIVVSRAIADASLKDVDPWLRVYRASRDGQIFGFTAIVARFAGATTDEAGAVTITVDLDPEALSGGQAEVLVVIRPEGAPPGAEPVGVDSPPDLLDADFAGTSLTTDTVMAILDGQLDLTDHLDNLGALPTEGATLHDGTPGGLVHYSFTVLGSAT